MVATIYQNIRQGGTNEVWLAVQKNKRFTPRELLRRSSSISKLSAHIGLEDGVGQALNDAHLPASPI